MIILIKPIILRQYKHKYDAVGIFGSRSPQLLVVNPELARRVFVSNFKNFHDNEIAKNIDEKTDFIFANNPFSLTGEKWKNRRADVTPGLTMGRVRQCIQVNTYRYYINVCKSFTD